MALSTDARWRLFIALTDKTIATEVADAIDATTEHIETVQSFHQVVIAPGHGSSSPGKSPAPIAIGVVLGDVYTVGNDDGFVAYKIPSNYAGNAKVHVHWTKSTDAVETGKLVKWKVSWLAADSGDDLNVAGSNDFLVDAYTDGGTTTRIAHETSELDIDGFAPGEYVYLKIEAVDPGAGALSQPPVLISLDLSLDLYVDT